MLFLPPKGTSSKRSASSSQGLSSSASPRRAARKKQRVWGVANEEESIQASSKGNCTRQILHTPRPLAACCISAFASGLRRMFVPDEKGGGLTREAKGQLEALPDHLRDRIWRAIINTGSGLVSFDIISTYFVSTPTILLPGASLASLGNARTLSPLSIPSFPNHVTRIEISGMPHVPDTSIANVVRKCAPSSLQALVLRGSSLAGEKTLAAIVSGKHGASLRILTLSSTAVKPAMLSPVLAVCVVLEELKLAGLESFNDNALGILTSKLAAQLDPRPLQALKKLKLRGANITSQSLEPLLALTPSLISLDISLCPVKTLPPSLVTNLQKLHLTGAAILAPTLAAFFRSGATADDAAALPPLQKLYLGAMNGWDDGDELIDLLSRMVPGAGGQLSKVTLAGSSILGLVATGPRVRLFQRFIEDVGRQLEHLDLSLLQLKSKYLEALTLPDTRIRNLILDETGIDDGLSRMLAGCKALEVLSLKGAKVDVPALFAILDACANVTTLDLTSVRGVPVLQRRNFFAVWEKEKERRIADGEVIVDGVVHLS